MSRKCKWCGNVFESGYNFWYCSRRCYESEQEANYRKEERARQKQMEIEAQKAAEEAAIEASHREYMEHQQRIAEIESKAIRDQLFLAQTRALSTYCPECNYMFERNTELEYIRYCPRCGYPNPNVCYHCGTPRRGKYCSHCGKEVVIPLFKPDTSEDFKRQEKLRVLVKNKNFYKNFDEKDLLPIRLPDGLEALKVFYQFLFDSQKEFFYQDIEFDNIDIDTMDDNFALNYHFETVKMAETLELKVNLTLNKIEKFDSILAEKLRSQNKYEWDDTSFSDKVKKRLIKEYKEKYKILKANKKNEHDKMLIKALDDAINEFNTNKDLHPMMNYFRNDNVNAIASNETYHDRYPENKENLFEYYKKYAAFRAKIKINAGKKTMNGGYNYSLFDEIIKYERGSYKKSFPGENIEFLMELGNKLIKMDSSYKAEVEALQNKLKENAAEENESFEKEWPAYKKLTKRKARKDWFAFRFKN